MRFHCCSETNTPRSILVHEPGEETRLAVQDPDFWGFDPSLKDDPRSFDKWLDNAKKEHQAFVAVLRNEGVFVREVQDLLNEKLEELREYIRGQFQIVLKRCESFDKNIQYAVLDAEETMLESPVNGVLLGLEVGKKFSEVSYETRKAIYKTLRTLMPLTSLYFTQDPVISVPAGLIQSRMGMSIRSQEPKILKIALGKEHYIYKLKNRTEGGDVTIHVDENGKTRMLVGISGQSGKNIGSELKRVSSRFDVDEIVKFFVPDYFDASKSYAGGNVMHLDTVIMPVSEEDVLANKEKLLQTKVEDGSLWTGDGLAWVRRHKRGLIEVPDEEQTGVCGWGSNVFPLGKRKIVSSLHLCKTNQNLREAGYEVFDIESKTLTSGYGSHHCMTAYLE